MPIDVNNELKVLRELVLNFRGKIRDEFETHANTYVKQTNFNKPVKTTYQAERDVDGNIVYPNDTVNAYQNNLNMAEQFNLMRGRVVKEADGLLIAIDAILNKEPVPAI